MVQKKSFIDSATPALVEMCFPSTFMDEMLVALDFLLKTLLSVSFRACILAWKL